MGGVLEEASGGAERRADSQDKGSRIRRLPRARRKLRWAGVGDEEQLEGVVKATGFLHTDGSCLRHPRVRSWPRSAFTEHSIQFHLRNVH